MSAETGKRIRAGMAAAGIRTASELSRKIGTSRQYAARLMSGEVESDSWTLLTTMSRLFGVSATWLRGGACSPTPRIELTPDEYRLIDLFRHAPSTARVAALEALSAGKIPK